MSLFDKLKSTNLKSLKFGQKQTAGDDSKPYIVTDINTADKGINKFRLTKFDDGLIRGGAIGSLNAGLTDTVRISKFLVDFPKGPLFILKQVGLQLSNPRLETKQLPTNRVGKGIIGKVVAGVSNIANKLNNLVGGPSRIYNLGINTLAQVPLNALGGHIVRHGFLPVQDESQKYIKVVDENNKNGNNRLERLYNTLLADTDTRVNFFKKNRYSSNLQTKIDDYLGGPKSIYGIGYTTIHRTTFTGDKTKIRQSLNINASKSRLIDNDIKLYTSKDDSIFNKYNSDLPQEQRLNPQNEWKGQYSQSLENSLLIASSKTSQAFFPTAEIDGEIVDVTPTSSFARRPKQFGNGDPVSTLLKFDPEGKLYYNRIDRPNLTPEDHILLASASYSPDNYGLSLLYKDAEGKDLKDYNVYNKGVRPLVPTFNPVYNKLVNSKVRKEGFRVPTTYIFDDKLGRVISETVVVGYASGSHDTKIVRLPLIKDKNDTRQYDYNIDSLLNVYERDDDGIMMVKFTQLDPFTGNALNYIPFSAYINGYQETYNSNWNEIKYNGRSDLFYVFDSYKKTVSFKLQIPIFKPHDLKVKHAALENLQRGMAGKYLDNRLGGVITRVRLGHYLRNAACIINSLNISIPEQASWDWGVDGNPDSAYAMLLEASFSITVIADDIPGFNNVTPQPEPEKKKEEVKKPDPKPDPKPVVDDKKPTVTKKDPLPVDPIKVDSTYVVPAHDKGKIVKKAENPKQVKKNYKFQGYKGGDFGGGGAGGSFGTPTKKAQSVSKTAAKNK